MEEQVLFNQIKALIEKEFKGIKVENNNLKKGKPRTERYFNEN